MEMNLELLGIQNPWWAGKSLEFDPVLAVHESKKLKWQPPLLQELDLKKDKIYALLGPRGVGKTTLLKLVIKDLLKKHKPEQVLYYSCHNLQTAEHLAELLKLFIHDRRRFAPGQRLFLIIDEVSLVDGWSRQLAHLQRAGLFKQAGLLLSGSSFLKNKGGLELETRLITSLDFAEFLGLLNPKLAQAVSTKSGYLKNQKRLDYYLDVYLLTGGFVSAINDFKKYGAVRQSIYSNFLYWLITDYAKMGRDILLWRQIMEAAVMLLGRPLKFQAIAKHSKAKTHNTVAAYLEILENIFCVKIAYQSEGGRLQTAKTKRLFFRDPFLFWLMYGYIHGSLNYWDFSRECLHRTEIRSFLYQNLVFSHLIKHESAADWGRKASIGQEPGQFAFKGKKLYTIGIDGLNQNRIRPDIMTGNDFKDHGQCQELPLTYFLLKHGELLLDGN